SHGNGRSVAGEYHFGPQDLVRFGEDGAFDFKLFRNGFDDKISGGDGRHIGGGFEASKDLRLLGFGELPFLDFAVEILADSVEAAVQEALFDIAENNGVARAREDMGDTVAHGACAENGDGFDRIESHKSILKMEKRIENARRWRKRSS